MDALEFSGLANRGVYAACVCHDKQARFEWDGRSAHMSADIGDTEISYEMAVGGAVSVSLFDAGERALGVAFHQKQDAGRQHIHIPNHLWLGRAAYYQIAVDGLARTALMPLE